MNYPSVESTNDILMSKRKATYLYTLNLPPWLH